MIRNIEHLVGAQVDINRAVWAANLADKEIAAEEYKSFKNEKERLEYVELHVELAFKDLQSYLQKHKQIKS